MLISLLPCLTAWAEGAEEARSIYVGDIVTLRVTARDISSESVKAAFRDFDILEIMQEHDGYRVSIRTFQIGEHTVTLGNRKIVIHVRSVLEDIERDTLFAGEQGLYEPGVSLNLLPFCLSAAGVFTLSLGFIGLDKLKKRKSKTPNPLQLFIKRTAALSAEDDRYCVALTFHFKEYMESQIHRRIIGKTSDEIMAGLQQDASLSPLFARIRAWLHECDRLKFTGVAVTAQDKQLLYEALLSLVCHIDKREAGLS